MSAAFQSPALHDQGTLIVLDETASALEAATSEARMIAWNVLIGKLNSTMIDNLLNTLARDWMTLLQQGYIAAEMQPRIVLTSP